MDILDGVSRGRVGSKYWVNSEHEPFSEITKANFQLPGHWAHSRFIRETPFRSAIMKPLNGYSMIFWPMPDVSFVDNKAILKYKTHAEIWLEETQNGLYALDKTWQRQFYPSQINEKSPDDCFNAIYKFYIPWVIDKDLSCRISGVDGSPFKIINETINFKKLDDSLVWDIDWFHFAIKNHGEHIEEYRGDTYGIIERGSDICYLVIDDAEVVEELRKQYDK